MFGDQSGRRRPGFEDGEAHARIQRRLRRAGASASRKKQTVTGQAAARARSLPSIVPPSIDSISGRVGPMAGGAGARWPASA